MIYYNVALVLALGMLAQAVAARLRLPSILLLLVAGTAAGPDLFGWVNPLAFGAARADIVSLAVTVILFEGGLALEIEKLREQQRSLTLLLTLGAAISMIGATVAAHYVLGVPWQIASLYGALMIVTGPTVVTPLLARITVERRVREILVSEGVIIDPIGAIVAIVALEYIVGAHSLWQTGGLLIGRLAGGALVGGAAGFLLAEVLRRRWVTDGLVNPVVLAVVLGAAAVANRLAGTAEAGLMAAVAMGVVMANCGLRDLGSLRQFKEELTVILLSFLFILLAADLPLREVRALGWGSLLVVAVLMWVVRPLAVFASTVGSDLTLRERLFISWICPRGIVAASVAGLFRILLTRADFPGGNRLEALVFVTVALTVGVQGLTAGPVARFLGVDLPSLQGTIIVGAERFGRLLARLLLSYERNVALIDRNPRLCREARAAGLPVYEGDALSVDVLEEAGARYVDAVLALTTNQELNTLIGQRVRDNFRVERVLVIGEERKPTSLFPGDFVGADEMNRLIRIGRVRLVEYEVPAGKAVTGTLHHLSYAKGEFALLSKRKDRVFIASGDLEVGEGDRILCARTTDEPSPLASSLPVVREVDARKV